MRALRIACQDWPLWRRLLVAGAALLLAGLLRLFAVGLEAGDGYPLFLPAVLLSGWLFGFRVGLAALGVAWLIGTFFFVEPAWSLVIDDPFDLAAGILFPLLAVLLMLGLEFLGAMRAAADGIEP